MTTLCPQVDSAGPVSDPDPAEQEGGPDPHGARRLAAAPGLGRAPPQEIQTAESLQGRGEGCEAGEMEKSNDIRFESPLFC